MPLPVLFIGAKRYRKHGPGINSLGLFFAQYYFSSAPYLLRLYLFKSPTTPDDG